jgi:threonine/homoserine/homoserine lactone efflux protein
VFWTALGEILVPAVGAAVAPMAIVAVLVLLSMSGGLTKGALFVAGFLSVTLSLTLILLLISDGAGVDDSSSASTTATVIKLLLGFGFLWLSLSQWKSRPKPGVPVASPKWMNAVEQATPAKAFVLGVVMAGANPKNISLAVTAAAAVAQTGSTSGVSILGVVIFALIASVGVAIPVLMVRFGPSGVVNSLEKARAYLVANNNLIMSVLLLVLGTANIAKALGPLFS